MKSIFITGAASGIGRASARLFAGRGWFVGGYDIDTAGLSRLLRELGDEHCIVGTLDVTDHKSFSSAVASFAEASGGRMDVLFNNAGVFRIDFFEHIPIEEQHRIIDVNFTGVVNGIHASLDLLKKTARAHGEARILTTSSAAGIYGLPEFNVYSGAKAAVRALTEALDIELARHNIRVADLLPGGVDTALLRNQARLPKLLSNPALLDSPEAIAELAYAAVHGRELHWFPRRKLALHDKLSRLFPRRVRERLARTVKS